MSANIHLWMASVNIVNHLQPTFWLASCYEHSAVTLRRQNFCSCWTSLVELSSSPAAQSRHHLQTVQM